jgi:hypothetical protein
VTAKEDQLRRITKYVQDAGESQNLMEPEQKSRKRNKENRGTETRDCSDYFGEECNQKEKEWEHEWLFLLPSRLAT